MGQPDFDNTEPSRKTWPPLEDEFPALVDIPEHQLLRCIGRGSYGQVWLARNSMGAYRAVKIVFRDSFDNERPFERELSGIRKFEPVSRLHDGFIDVLQVGINEERGYFYYVMEAGDDQHSGQTIDPEAYLPNTLASEIAQRDRFSLPECLQLGLALTAALAELHKHGLVHRDIKPSNVIFVDGKPKLADIGLVAGVDETRSYVGTEGFIPPEGPGTPQADLYSLGKVLYEGSTGKDRLDFPEIPTEWSQSPDYAQLLELNEVILQGCKSDPKDRYSSAWDMHADLVVVLNGKSVKRLRLLEERMSRLKRFAGVAALVLAVGGLVSYQIYRDVQAAMVEHQRQVDGNVTYGNRALEAGDFLGALPYFAKALSLDRRDPDRERTHRLRLGSVLSQCPKLTQMWTAKQKVWDAEFSPDGKSVLWANYYGQAEIHDLQTGRLYSHPFGPESGLCSATYSPDGTRILTTSENSTAIVWDAVSLSVLCRLPHNNKVLSGRFSPDGRRIVTACKDGVARVWNAQTYRFEFALQPHAQAVAFAGFSHDSGWIVTASNDGTARIWNATNGEPRTAPLVHPAWVRWAAFSPDNTKIVTACDDHKARVWDAATGTRIMPDLPHYQPVESAEFSPDGRLILTASLDGTARLWRSDDHQPLDSNPVLRHGEPMSHAAFSRDGRQIITTCDDGSVRVWDLAGATMPPPATHRVFCRDGRRFRTITNNRIEVCEAEDDRTVCQLVIPGLIPEQARLSFKGNFVLSFSGPTASGRTNHLLQVWQTDTSSPVGPPLSVSESCTNVTLSEDGGRIAICDGKRVEVRDTRTGARVCAPLSHQEPVTAAVFSPDASRLVTLSGANAYVWNTATGSSPYPPLKHPASVCYAEFSRDGRLLVTCCFDTDLTHRFAQVWDARTGRPVNGPLWHDDGVLSASFSRDGTRLVTASEDFTAKVWDVKTGRQIGLPLRHADQVNAAAFSPDGQWVATASADDTARVWDPQTGNPLTPPLLHLAPVVDLEFVPDGRRLVTRDNQGRSFEWLLHVDSRPVSALVELTAFLDGGQSLSPGDQTNQPGEPRSTIWQRLRAKYPQDFTVSKKEIVRWHQFQVDESETEELWSAAAFHLDCLLKLHPGDRAVAHDLARVQEILDQQNRVP